MSGQRVQHVSPQRWCYEQCHRWPGLLPGVAVDDRPKATVSKIPILAGVRDDAG